MHGSPRHYEPHGDDLHHLVALVAASDRSLGLITELPSEPLGEALRVPTPHQEFCLFAIVRTDQAGYWFVHSEIPVQKLMV
jgi:hypothetical protein